jgi:signal transduction histidine kinase
LSLAKSLIELMDGRIWVKSATGTGSTFSVLVPAAKIERIEATR